MLDDSRFRAELAEATRSCFAFLVQKHGREGLYAFVLYTADDVAGVNPSASYESGYRERRKKLFSDEDRLRRLAEHGIDAERCALGDLRWSAYEWEHECFEVDRFDDANREMQAAFGDVQADVEFAKRKVAALAAMTLTFKRLADEGTFGRGAERESLALFCSVPTSDVTCWLERESARLLNSPALFEKFDRERLDWIEDDEQDDAANEMLASYRSIVDRELRR